MAASEFCYYHHPDYDEKRCRRGSKGGRKAGRGRLVVAAAGIQSRLEGLAEDVLDDEVETSKASVAGQLLNYALRAIAVGLKAKEVEELEARLEEVEERLERHAQEGSRGWGS